MRHALLLFLSLVSVGCAAPEKMNPTFMLTVEDAQRAIDEMNASPVRLKRPVVILSGYLDPGIGPTHLDGCIKDATTDAQIIPLATGIDANFDAARAHVIREVEARFPSDDPHQTVEVDVIGHSMGGLVGRYSAVDLSAIEGGPPKRLRIVRLFTISSPHRGARLADLPCFDSRPLGMRGGSTLLQRLDAELEKLDYEIIPYVRLDDITVGEWNAAPWGRDAWWVSNLPGQSSHLLSAHDPRIVADILRRLRGETPYTKSPAEPLPKKKS